MKKCTLLIVLCASTAFTEGLLLTPDETIAQQATLRMVDIRSAEAFLTERIPESIWLSEEEFSEERNGLSGMLPPTETLIELLSSRGISQNMHLVLYGDNNNAGDLVAVTRVFWALEYLGYPKVSILDGGLSRWKAEGKKLTSDPPTAPLPPVSVSASEQTHRRLAEKTDVVAALENKSAALVDARPENQYSGAALIRGTKRKGHIPGAFNIPYSAVISMPHALFRSPDELKKILYPDGITIDTPVITYCNTGKSSSLIYFAYRLVGHKEVASYDGSIIEWCADESLPVSTD